MEERNSGKMLEKTYLQILYKCGGMEGPNRWLGSSNGLYTRFEATQAIPDAPQLTDRDENSSQNGTGASQEVGNRSPFFFHRRNIRGEIVLEKDPWLPKSFSGFQDDFYVVLVR
jgi:hypothetical protein